MAAADKVYTGVNSEFREIVWLWPSNASADTGVIDSYVIHSPEGNYWIYGSSFYSTFKDRNVYPLFFKYFIPWGWFITSKDWIIYRKYTKQKKKESTIKDKLFLKIKKIVGNKNRKIWSLEFIEYNLIKNKKIIFPNKSLIKNIGFDGSGVNSSITNKFSTLYSKPKKINVAKIYQNESLQKKQLSILFKRVKYFF